MPHAAGDAWSSQKIHAPPYNSAEVGSATSNPGYGRIRHHWYQNNPHLLCHMVFVAMHPCAQSSLQSCDPTASRSQPAVTSGPLLQFPSWKTMPRSHPIIWLTSVAGTNEILRCHHQESHDNVFITAQSLSPFEARRTLGTRKSEPLTASTLEVILADRQSPRVSTIYNT